MKILHTILVSALFLLISGCGASRIPATPHEIERTELEFVPRKPIEWQLANGLKVYFLEDKELPLVSGTLYLPGGSLYEPDNLIGLASATGSQMREGGVVGMSPEKFDETLDTLGASIETGYGEEFGSASFSGLSDDADTIFGYFSKVIQQPAFETSRFLLWKKMANESIERRRDNPDVMSGMLFAKAMYGEHSPYSKSSSKETVNRISKKDIQDFHNRFVRPNGARLTVTGALDESQVRALVEKHFGSWKASNEIFPTPPKETFVPEPGVYVIERDFDQASILLGHEGPTRISDDMYALRLFNEVFGAGGFGSTLVREIRSKLGLAYSVYGGFSGGTEVGTFQIAVGTRVTGAVQAIDRILELTKEAKEVAPKEDVLLRAKDSVERGYVFRFDKPRTIVERSALLEILGYPKDFDAHYLERLRAVTPATVKEAANNRLKPENMVIVIVGRVSSKELAAHYKGKLPVFRVDFDTEPRISKVQL